MIETFYGCDIDLRHGAITKITLDPDDDTITSAKAIYRWGGKGSFTLGMKDDFPTMMRWSQTLADSILRENIYTEGEPPIYIEWDKARVYYKNSNKMAVVQLAQAVGAISGYLGPQVKLVTPREVKLLSTIKTPSLLDFIEMLRKVGFRFEFDSLETFDTKGDYTDSIVAGLAGYRKYQVQSTVQLLKESNEQSNF